MIFCPRVTTFVHDLEAGWQRSGSWVTFALAFNVQGAFDSLIHEVLIELLHYWGFPT